MICEKCRTELDVSYCLYGCVQCERCECLNWKEGEPLCICYHGTGGDNAKSILEEGFKIGTWFAKHLEDALGFGGSHLFGVMFVCKNVSNSWQFQVDKALPPARIVSYKVFSIETKLDNLLLGEEIFESNIPPERRALAREEFEIMTSSMPKREKVRKLNALRRKAGRQ